jgi:hypothetical protein
MERADRADSFRLPERAVLKDTTDNSERARSVRALQLPRASRHE